MHWFSVLKPFHPFRLKHQAATLVTRINNNSIRALEAELTLPTNENAQHECSDVAHRIVTFSAYHLSKKTNRASSKLITYPSIGALAFTPVMWAHACNPPAEPSSPPPSAACTVSTVGV